MDVITDRREDQDLHRTTPYKVEVTSSTLDSPARTNQVIIASDRLWCFSARTNQVVVQVFNEFSAGVEVLFNYLVFVVLVLS